MVSDSHSSQAHKLTPACNTLACRQRQQGLSLSCIQRGAARSSACSNQVLDIIVIFIFNQGLEA